MRVLTSERAVWEAAALMRGEKERRGERAALLCRAESLREAGVKK